MKPGSLMQSQGNAERCRLKQVKGDASRWRQGREAGGASILNFR